MGAIDRWGPKGPEKMTAELKQQYNETWTDQNARSTYVDFIIVEDAREKADKTDREAVATALHTIEGGRPNATRVAKSSSGRRVGAGLAIIQWLSGVPVMIYLDDLALAEPIWPRK
jgi:branched-chain amino acid transport system substrate-binding protein